MKDWSYSETARQFGVVRSRITAWERIYLEEGAAGSQVERRGRGSKGRPEKLPQKIEEKWVTDNSIQPVWRKAVSVTHP